MTEPKFGPFPIRTELTILPADDPKDLELAAGWVFRDYNGTKVAHYIEADHPEKRIDTDKLETAKTIAVGDKLLIQGIFGYHIITVIQVKGDSAVAESEKQTYHLRLNQDERQIWACEHIHVKGR